MANCRCVGIDSHRSRIAVRVIRERDRLVFVCFSLQLGSLLAVSSPALRETYLFVSGIAYLGLADSGSPFRERAARPLAEEPDMRRRVRALRQREADARARAAQQPRRNRSGSYGGGRLAQIRL